MNINEIIYTKTKVDKQDFSYIYNFVKNDINATHRGELSGDLTTDEAKERYKMLIHQTLHANNLFMEGYTESEFIEILYNALVKYDFLTPYLEGGSEYLPKNDLYNTWEEINCNRYDDIEVIVAGKKEKLKKGFDSPERCMDIVSRLARIGNLTLDKSTPRGDSSIGNSIRMVATAPPCVDADVGATFSIRRQKSSTTNRDFFIKSGTATEDELDFLEICINNRVSIGFAGGTGSGKTTDIDYLLNCVDPSNRIYTVEDTREWNAVKKDEKGQYTSSVVHTVTKASENDSQAVTADDLVKDALRYDPNIIGLGEMRGKEAKTTIMTGGTDHTLITGLHANGVRAAYRRMTTLYMDASTNLPVRMVYENIVEAIPIIVHKNAFKSGERRYMTIAEATLSPDLLNPEIKFTPIFKYIVKDFERKDGKVIKVIGEHKKVGNISNALAQRLFENGVTLDQILRFSDPKFEPGMED